MGQVFISYRHDDAGVIEDFIEEALRKRLDERVVASPNLRTGIQDVMSDQHLPQGADWDRSIHEAISACAVFLILIGRRWLTDDAGNLRLFAKNDVVSWEIELALHLNKYVLPVLIDNTRMPAAENLPPKIAQLSKKQALHLRQGHLQPDLENIVNTVYSTLYPDQLKSEFVDHYLDFVKAEQLPYALSESAFLNSGLKRLDQETPKLMTWVDPERIFLTLGCQPLGPRNVPSEDVRNWLQRAVGGSKPSLLLADYGMGKTYATVELFCKLARDFKQDPSQNIIPVFVRLRSYRAGPLFNDPVAAVVAALSFSWKGEGTQGSYSVTRKQVEELLSANRIFIIFDGLDEIPDIRTVPNPVDLINALTRLTGPGYTRWVATSRTGIFARFLPFSEPLCGYQVARLNAWPPECWVEFVDRCSHEARLFSSRSECDDFLQTVSALPEVSQLTSTPLHARMLLEIRTEIISRKLDMNLPKLFERYTDFILSAKASVPAATEVRRRCFEAPAYHFFRSGVSYASRSDLLRAADVYVTDWGIEELSEFFRHELQTYSLMHCREDAKFSFSHSSFYQYFFGCVVLREMRAQGTVNVSLMNQRFFSRGEALFVGQLLTLEENKELREELQETLRGSNLPTAGPAEQNTLEVALSAGCDLKGAILNDLQLHGLVFDHCDVSNASLRTARLSGVSLVGTNMQNCNLRGARLDECNLAGTQMQFASLRGARVSNLFITRLEITGRDRDLPLVAFCDFGDPSQESDDVRVDAESGALLLEAVRADPEGNQSWREQSLLVLSRAIKKAQSMSNF